MSGARFNWLPSVLVLATCSLAAEASDSSTREREFAESFLQKYCLRCHDEQKQSGQFRLDALSRDFTDLAAAQKWDEVIVQMNAGEMPPQDEPKPTAEDLGRVVEWLSARLRDGKAARMTRRGRITHHRLSRAEYQNTVLDLLGVHYDVTVPGAFNEDPRWRGFDRIGALLTLSPSHVDHYLKAAEAVLDDAYPKNPVATGRYHFGPYEILRKNKDEIAEIEDQVNELSIKEPMRVVLWPGASVNGFPAAGQIGKRDGSGLFRLRIQLSGLAGLNGQTPHLALSGKRLAGFDADVLAAEDKPVVIEFESYLPFPIGLNIENEIPGAFKKDTNRAIRGLRETVAFAGFKDSRLLNPHGYKLFAEDGKAIHPLLLLDWIEWEGPIITDEVQRLRDSFVPVHMDNVDEIKVCLRRLARRAWRRKVEDDDLDRYLELFASELRAGETPDSAYRAAMIGILTSKNFYYLEEGSPDIDRDKLNDWELASRLSYFLWSSTPDPELLAAAESGRLHEPDVLLTQLGRMLADSKSERFLKSFPNQWLQLHRVGMFAPNPKRYPHYDPWLERSMVLETELYFREMFNQNRPLREFLISDWTMLNPRLRTHYGLSKGKSLGFEQAVMSPEDHRGGLLTHASVLSLTSDGDRHRPVHRGAWLSEAVFNWTPPPPPPNVEPLELTPDDGSKTTIRMEIEAHAKHATCASCHRKIDPLGFAFENYDAIGRWRTEEGDQRNGVDPAVNATGELPNGKNFAGPEEFKSLLARDQDRFAVAFIEQVATYALRRVMTIDDAEQINAIAAATRSDEYRTRAVIERLVLSDLFQKR